MIKRYQNSFGLCFFYLTCSLFDVQLYNMSMQLKRTYANKSSINFAAFREPEINHQQNRIYQKHSQIGQLMNDFPQNHTITQNKFTQNIISNITEKHQIPVYESTYNHKSNNDYLEFFHNHKVFLKPYASNTKFVDLLNRNKSLLRTEPLKNDAKCQKTPNSLKKKNKYNRKYRYFRHAEKTKTLPNQKKQQKSDQSFKMFDRTLSTTFTVYQSLFEKDRSQKSESVILSNSINRMLAAQSIRQGLKPKNRQFNLTECDA